MSQKLTIVCDKTNIFNKKEKKNRKSFLEQIFNFGSQQKRVCIQFVSIRKAIRTDLARLGVEEKKLKS